MRRFAQWQRCACKDCNELARIPKLGGKSFCQACEGLGCAESFMCVHKNLALHEDRLSARAVN